MIVKGKKVILRPIELEDIELSRQLLNDPWMEAHTVGWSLPISSAQQKEWYENSKNTSSHIRFAIEIPDIGTVGFTGLKNIDWKNGTADGGGMKIAKRENMSRGIATDAYMALLHYAFYELRLNRVNGSVLMSNLASRKATAKVGFKEEGVQRQAVFKNGSFQDVILLGVLKSDYDLAAKTLGYWENEGEIL